MRRLARLPACVLCLAALCGASIGCGAPEKPAAIEVGRKPAPPSVPPEIAAVASTALGQGADVIAFGDLAHNGRRQVLVANRTGAASDPESAVRFTRAAVFEQAGSKWAEVLRCDEYLKNPNGFLGGIPHQPVASWQLEFTGKNNDHGRELLFTPLEKSGATLLPAVAVRWNPAAQRYQSMDPQSGQFLQEVQSLETPVSPLR